MHNPALTLPLLSLLLYLAPSTAQLIGEIGDGQIQAPTAAASAPEATAAPADMMPEATAAATTPAIIVTATSPCPNATLAYPSGAPASLPSARIPLFPANTSMATGTGMMGMGGNASAPTVPAAPTMAGAAPTEEGGSGSGSTGGGPKEAGTSAPAVAASSGAERGNAGWGMGFVGAVVGWGMVVGIMG